MYFLAVSHICCYFAVRNQEIMNEEQTKCGVAPDFLYLDAIMLAYRLGQVRYQEQKQSLIAAARAANDPFSFLTALESFGIRRQSQLFRFVSKVIAAPAYYRSQYALALGIHREGEVAESFLNNQRVLSLVEAVLTSKQQTLFFETYWWFVHNHKQNFVDMKRGPQIGVYANEPRDNASTIERFEDYMFRLMNHKTKTVRTRFDGFPADIVLAILKRAFYQAQQTSS